jgi:hypothetical protein
MYTRDVSKEGPSITFVLTLQSELAFFSHERVHLRWEPEDLSGCQWIELLLPKRPLSLRMRTDASGNITDQRGTFPYGEGWYGTAGSTLVFTSYKRDTESGNDYAQARSYVSGLARFSSPDLSRETPMIHNLSIVILREEYTSCLKRSFRFVSINRRGVY